MIYLWNDKQLAHDLRQNMVTEKAKFGYLLLFIFGPIILGEFCGMLSDTSEMDPFTIFCIIWFEFLLTLTGIAIVFLLHKINAAGDSKHFIERFICLSVPVLIRLTAFTVPFAVMVIITCLCLIMPMFSNGSAPAGLSIAAIIAFAFRYYYTRLKILINIASGQEILVDGPLPAPQL